MSNLQKSADDLFYLVLPEKGYRFTRDYRAVGDQLLPAWSGDQSQPFLKSSQTK
jgi:hypothetical protein